jgi:gluconolactonase
MALITRRTFVRGAAGVTLAAAASAQDSSAPVEFARSEEFSEGPVFDYEGNLFFTHGRFVTRVKPDRSRAVWAETSGANGHKVLPDGNHLLCVTGDKAIVLFSPDGKVIRAASTECHGMPLRAPNDLTLDRRGGFYFTDPGGSRDKPIGTVHYVDSAGVTHLVAGGMWVPNGLVLSQDGRTLFVAETLPNRVVKFAVDDKGKLGALEEFAQLPFRDGHQPEPDGMALDTNGNLYVAHLGTSTVKVLAANGSPLRTLQAGNYDASNLVFGGKDLNELYVTGSTGHRSNTPGRVYQLSLPWAKGVSSLQPR